MGFLKIHPLVHHLPQFGGERLSELPNFQTQIGSWMVVTGTMEF